VLGQGVELDLSAAAELHPVGQWRQPGMTCSAGVKSAAYPRRALAIRSS
jgi:hypothetical protein